MKSRKKKYRPFPSIKLVKRRWPNHTITLAPILSSVDLRDGNQSLPVPMTVEKKLVMFKLLVDVGFKEIEVGFPASSDTDFRFVRTIIENGLIPSDVTIQVLVQAREDQIKKTVEALVGAERVIIHLYNSTSPAQRRVVFGLGKPEIMQIAVQGTKWVKKHSVRLVGTKVVFQYSPESFSATESDFALEVCHEVMKAWRPTRSKKMILNLPNTVEVAMPNVYADQVEWFIRNLKNRQSVIISVHSHNDRGTGVAATELALLAGADRVEGTLFGNGERTGNIDIITVALNLYMHGIDPMLDFSNIDQIREVYEKCTGMIVPDRQPYSGKLVFTAFSGSHQDAIRKGLAEQAKGGREQWDVPYLTIDPKDIGRTYETVIRFNSQSGRGGVSYLLQKEYGITLPKDLEREFGPIAKSQVDKLGREVSAEELKEMFWKEYIDISSDAGLCHDKGLCSLVSFTTAPNSADEVTCSAVISRVVYASSWVTGDSCWYPREIELRGIGNGPIAAFISGLENEGLGDMTVVEYSEHALGGGNNASAIAYICLEFLSGKKCWGVGVDLSIEKAPIRAVLSALSRYEMRSA